MVTKYMPAPSGADLGHAVTAAHGPPTNRTFPPDFSQLPYKALSYPRPAR